jgi:hypothetical protein
MVTEDYVSFETAKLLKEKGFDEVCFKYALNDKIYNNGDFVISHDDDVEVGIPTLQMVMKWLREVHRIDIEVRTHYLNYLKPNDTRFYSGKILKGSEDVIHTIYSKDTYEEVCELAIKYCLENLI